jgi:hypothetical protein
VVAVFKNKESPIKSQMALELGGRICFIAMLTRSVAVSLHRVLWRWYLTSFVHLSPDVITLQLFTPQVVGV